MTPALDHISMKLSTVLIIWIVCNVLFLSFFAYQHHEYISNEYVEKGLGKNAKIITKQDNPEYYASRVKYMWSGYFLIPVVSGVVAYIKSRQLKNLWSNKTDAPDRKNLRGLS